MNGKAKSLSHLTRKVARHFISPVLDLYKDARSLYFLKKMSTKRHDPQTPIRVAFVVQMPEIWDKEEPIFGKMVEDSRFVVDMIVVPAYDLVRYKVGTEYDNNFFLEKYPGAIKAYCECQWIELGDQYDYVFYQRPYDYYLPLPLRSDRLVKVAKCCYVPYGYSGADIFNGGNTNRSFFRNMSIVFAESEYMSDVLRIAYKKRLPSRLHKVENLGYPALSPYFEIKPSKQFKNILWTPRWTYNPQAGGGSHFLEYKELFLQLPDSLNTSNLHLVFRPHPLMFGELVSKGLISNEAIDDYISRLQEKSIEYDSGKPILETFRNTDVLISDFSTIIVQFFLTGRPIIFCDSDIVLNPTYSELLEGIYVAHNEKDILKYLSELQKGNDYLFKRRQQIINKFFSAHKDATQRIVEYIVQDYGIKSR